MFLNPLTHIFHQMNTIFAPKSFLVQKFLAFANSGWRVRMYLLAKLPAAWFMGIGVKSCSAEQCVVRLPYGWRSQNPFNSTYFAAQCAAAEFSTGMLCRGIIMDYPGTSMLVRHIEAEFSKKASQELLFTCDDGALAKQNIEEAIATGEARTVRMQSTGRLPDGTEASKVWITWSFKKK
jgi:Domain of unknown function (DUF4442)